MSQPAAANSTTAPQRGVSCPVEALGIEIVDILAKRDELEEAIDRRAEEPHRAAGARLRWNELGDRLDHLAERASWLTPTSPRGATLIHLLMLDAERSEHFEFDGETEQEQAAKARRRFLRLSHRLTEFLVAQSGASVAEQGLSAIHVAGHEIAAAQIAA